MKNILIAGSVILLYTTTVDAQSESVPGNEEKEVRQETAKKERELRRENLTASYQNIQALIRDFADPRDISWKVSNYFDEATFNNNGVIMTAYYDRDNELVGTTTEKSFDDLPLKAREFINKHYSDYKPDDVILFDDNESNDTDMELYNTPFEDEDNYFILLKKNNETVVLKSDMGGEVTFFKKL